MTNSEIVRDQILTHGLGLASARGLMALSTSDLARELSLSRSGILNHFSDKEALQLGVIEKAAAIFIADVVHGASGSTPGEAHLRELFARWLTWARSPRLSGGCPFVHASAESDALPKRVRDQLDAFRTEWSATLQTAINEGKAAGEFADNVDAEQLTFELYGLYLSHHFWYWSMKDRAALDRTKRAFERLIAASRPRAAA